jgi:hypothetical protein
VNDKASVLSFSFLFTNTPPDSIPTNANPQIQRRTNGSQRRSADRITGVKNIFYADENLPIFVKLLCRETVKLKIRFEPKRI